MASGMNTGARMVGTKIGLNFVSILEALILSGKFFSWCGEQSKTVCMGEDELPHRSCREHVSAGFWSR